jgi:hypothetical protein
MILPIININSANKTPKSLKAIDRRLASIDRRINALDGFFWGLGLTFIILVIVLVVFGLTRNG